MSKILLCARREYSATVLTKAFFLGAIVFPLVAWGAIIGVTASGVFNAEKPPLEGTIAIIDSTGDQPISAAVAAAMDPEAREAARAALKEQLSSGPAAAMMGSLPENQRDAATEVALKMAGLGGEFEVAVESYDTIEALPSLQERLRLPEDDPEALLAFAVVAETSVALPLPIQTLKRVAEEFGVPITDEQLEQLESQGKIASDGASEDDALANGEVRVVHRRALDPDYVSTIQRELRVAVENERYSRVGISPGVVRQYESSRPIISTRMIGDDGEEEDSTATAQRIVPIAFFMLLYISVLTGGNYLFMGTLEEKGSRVMEVLLSAVSPMHLLVGKLVGQGLVGLTVLGIYLTLGLLAADRFGFLSAIPMDALPWMLPYFLMAYLFFGALFVAVGSAVTEVREAQSLFAPVTFLIILIFVILFPIMDNPGAPIARVMSYFPPATPFVMVMRMSQPSHVVPLWELFATGIVGALGVLFTIWMASKIFRVGVLMYGKPPSFGTLLKWVMQS